MKSSEQLNKIINETLIKEKNFKLVYDQIAGNEEMQSKFEDYVGVKWQYCGIIAAYSGLLFQKVNICLRSPSYKCDRAYLNIFTELLNEALQQMESMDKTELCRNERHIGKEDAFDWFKSHIGSIVTYPGFTSTSNNWQTVSERNMFKILTKKSNSNAKNIIPVMEIFQPERAKNENEILFMAPTSLTIKNVIEGMICLEESEKNEKGLILTNSYWTFTDQQLVDLN